MSDADCTPGRESRSVAASWILTWCSFCALFRRFVSDVSIDSVFYFWLCLFHIVAELCRTRTCDRCTWMHRRNGWTTSRSVWATLMDVRVNFSLTPLITDYNSVTTWYCWLGICKMPVSLSTKVLLQNEWRQKTIISCSSKIQNGLPFWCWLTQVVPEKRPLNGCTIVVVICVILLSDYWCMSAFVVLGSMSLMCTNNNLVSQTVNQSQTRGSRFLCSRTLCLSQATHSTQSHHSHLCF